MTILEAAGDIADIIFPFIVLAALYAVNKRMDSLQKGIDVNWEAIKTLLDVQQRMMGRKDKGKH